MAFDALVGLVNDGWRVKAPVNVVGLWRHWPFESGVIWHRRRQRKRSIHHRWRYPWWLVAVVIPSSIRVVTSVNYRGDKKH